MFTEKDTSGRRLQKRQDNNHDDQDDNNDRDDKDDDVEEESNSILIDGEYGIIQRGSKYNSDFRTYIKDANGIIVSPFHDIPLKRKSENINPIAEV